MTIRTYLIGFGLSLTLTLAAFLLVAFMPLAREATLAALVAFALMQFVVQLVCFLHLGRGRGAYWNFIAFAFALFIVIVLVGGSLWIMSNLKERTHDISELFPTGEISPHMQDD